MDTRNAIAVIGLACRYPGARDPRQLWENILAGRRQFRRLPRQRFPLEDYHHPDPKTPDQTYLQQAALIDGFEFDWARRRIPRSTFLATDIAHWLALEVALEALADAGYDRQRLPRQRTGVIIGNSLTGEQSRSQTLRLRWPFVRRAFLAAARAQGLPHERAAAISVELERVFKSVFAPVNEDTLAGGLSNTIAGRICNYLDLYGGGYTVDGACASSLLAVATAAERLQNGDLDLALAGGVDVSLDPFELVGFAKTGAFARNGLRIYDRKSNGFLPGEGCGVVVLKRLADARQAGDTVYAVVRGWGISSDGAKSGITAPNATGQSLAMQRAYQEAPYDMGDLHFVEGHGTGTAVGDRVELEAIALAMPQGCAGNNGNLRTCGITSLKSLIGHTKAASGIGGFIKTVMAVNRRILPPLNGCLEPHPAFDAGERRLYPIRQGRCGNPSQKMRAGVSAMGFGGINCHVTLESENPPSPRFAPEVAERALLVSRQSDELFILTADSLSELETLADDWCRISREISMAEMTDLAVHLAKLSNSEAALRAALLAETPGQLSRRLKALGALIREKGTLAEGALIHGAERGIWMAQRVRRTRVGILFPGQGSQMLNMAGDLMERFAWARDFAQQAETCFKEGGTGPIQAHFLRPTQQVRDPRQIEVWQKALARTNIAQPAICLASLLWWRFLEDLGISADAVGGHSLGELSAFHVAGAFGFAELCRFVGHRATAMALDRPRAGAMLSLRCPRDQAEAILSRVSGAITLANINSPRQMVLSGEETAIEAARKLATREGLGAVRLPVGDGFHSPLMTPVAQALKDLGVLPKSLKSLSRRLFSSVTGAEILPGLALEAHFARQVVGQVDFEGMLRNMAPACDILIEVGPGRVLSGLAGDILGPDGPVCLPVETSSQPGRDLNRLLALLFVMGHDLHWEALYAGRLVRPFVEPAKLAFIENPCERPFPVSSKSCKDAPQCNGPVSDEILACLADLPEFQQAAYLDRRRAFLAEMVRADLKYFKADASSQLPAGDPRQDQKEPAMAPPQGEPSQTSQPSGADQDLQTILYELVETITGYAPESLALSMRLLDDLNLDSIKSGDLVAKAARAAGVQGQLDPQALSNATLGDLLQRLQALSRGALGGPAKSRTPDVLETVIEQLSRVLKIPERNLDADALLEAGLGLRPEQLLELLKELSFSLGMVINVDPGPLLERSPRQVARILERLLQEQAPTQSPLAGAALTSWVREFCVELVQAPLTPLTDGQAKRKEDDWQSANVLILYAPDTDELAGALSEELIRHGSQIEQARFDDSRTQALTADVAFTHLVAVLPRKPDSFQANQVNLRCMVEQLVCLLPLPPAAQAPRRRTAVTYIQFGDGYFGMQPQVADLNPCCATALAKSLHLERSDLKVRVLDFCAFSDPAEIVSRILTEMMTPASFAAVGFDRHLTRRMARQRLLQPVFYRPRPATIGGEDVLLVTGGAKGVTAACALGLARATGCRTALVGRSTFNEDEVSDSDAGQTEIQETLRAYQALGLQARYFSCDICDLEATARVLETVRSSMGPVGGVIHGAGLNHPRPAGQTTVTEALNEVSPKIMGALNLLNLLVDAPPKLFVGLSSIIGVTGMPGNAWYGFSNESLDLILNRFKAEHPQTETLSVAFSIWRDIGMGARMGSVEHLSRMGIDAIDSQEGIRRFVRLCLNDPGTAQVIVTARLAGLDTWSYGNLAEDLGWRYLEQCLSSIPGVESVFLARLSLAQDPYLKDHCFNGSYLFPAVCGLEAMAQAAAHVTGKHDFAHLCIENIQTLRPISVDPQEGAEIVIWAQVDEATTGTDLQVVHCGIQKRLAADAGDCFSATFLFGPAEPLESVDLETPARPLDIVPQEDLYRETLLFQGPLFQRIEAIWQLEAKGDGAVRALFSSRWNPLEAGTRDAGGTPPLLGDYLWRDTLLQAAQLLVPRQSCLPVAIRRLQVHPQEQRESVAYWVEACLTRQDDREIEAQIMAVDDQGRVVERLEGYRLHILAARPENPSAADLIAPDARDQRMVGRLVEAIGRDLEIDLPGIGLQHLNGLHQLGREERHQRELPLLQATAEKVLAAHGADPAGVAIQWLASGKPVIKGVLEGAFGLSLTHDEGVCLCTAGPAPQGCDLQPVTDRSRQEWQDLLGVDAGPLLDTLMGAGDSLNRAGTRIWSAKEALGKALGGPIGTLTVAGRQGDAVLLQSVAPPSPGVATIPLRLTRGAERLLALVGRERPSLPVQPSAVAPGEDEDYSRLFNEGEYALLPHGGPQGQMVFVQRIPVTFRASAQLSRSVYFANYLFWLGEVRESSAWPVLGKMAKEFASAQFGGVTNYCRLKILGEAHTGDRIEMRIWASDNGGPADSTMELTVDFRKMLADGASQRLAWCVLQTTWVRVLEHGVVKPEPYPAYYRNFLRNMLPCNEAPNTPEPLTEPLAHLHQLEADEVRFQAVSAPTIEPVLHEQIIETSLDHANLVGNVYFAYYHNWLGRTRDRCFYNLIPDHFNGNGHDGELLCLSSRIDHLREAMPFDRIRIRMALKVLRRCSAVFHFDFLRCDTDGRQVKLAFGEHQAVWVVRDEAGRPMAAEFPQRVQSAFQKAIQSADKVKLTEPSLAN